MKRTAVLLFLSLLGIISLFTACGGVTPPVVTPPPPTESPTPPAIGEGVSITYPVTNEDAALEVTGCPSYGDKSTPYVLGKMTKGDPFSYEIICMIMVNNAYYGKKPFNDSPGSPIKSNNEFKVQFSSNDGVGTDYNADSILLFLVPVGYDDGIVPDVQSGYIVPPEQVSALKDDSVCVVQIDREIVVED